MTENSPHRERLYPLFLKLAGKACLVVGGGSIALQKAEALVSCGACVTVVALEAVPELIGMADAGQLALELHPYSSGEAGRFDVVIAATNRPSVNQMVFDDGHAGRALVNVVDVPELCDFYVPSVLQRGRLQVAVSTAGASPRLARRVRRQIEEMLPHSYEDLLDCLYELRAELKRLLPDNPGERMKINMRIADSDEATLFLNGDQAPLKEIIKHALDAYRG